MERIKNVLDNLTAISETHEDKCTMAQSAGAVKYTNYISFNEYPGYDNI